MTNASIASMPRDYMLRMRANAVAFGINNVQIALVNSLHGLPHKQYELDAVGRLLGDLRAVLEWSALAENPERGLLLQATADTEQRDWLFKFINDQVLAEGSEFRSYAWQRFNALVRLKRGQDLSEEQVQTVEHFLQGYEYFLDHLGW